MGIRNFKDTKPFKLAYEQAMDVFRISICFPPEGKFSLTDQIRKSSRSVCANFAEAYRKKIYPAHFVLKITDSDAENSETGVWFYFAKDCGYITPEQLVKLMNRNEEIGRLLNHMINNPEKY